MKKNIRFIASALAAALSISICTVPVYAKGSTASDSAVITQTLSGAYEHDPRLNSKAMEDIVVDPNAVYGFAPAPDSDRLKEFAKYDWSDPEFVEKSRQERIQYLQDFDKMYELKKEMEEQGASIEEIARSVSALRNQLRLDSYKDNPEGLETVKKSNLEKYGDENGPTADSLYEKYGSWEKVLQKSFSANSGMDAVLGLYDEQYEYNVMCEAVVESPVVTYTVKEGDNLSKISVKYFGDRYSWKKIYNANRALIRDPALIYAGQVLIIPIND